MQYPLLTHLRVYPTVVLALCLMIVQVWRRHPDRLSIETIENIEIAHNAPQELKNVEGSLESALPIEEPKSLNKTDFARLQLDRSNIAPLPSGSTWWQYPIAKAPVWRPLRTIAMISMGPGAHRSRLVERILISIRKRGNYLGMVLILTDDLRRYTYLAERDPNLIILRPPAEDWKMELLEDMPYKRFKTFLLEYLDLNEQLQTVKYVYYLDIDIVVGRPLQEWFEYVERSYMSSENPSQIIMFKGNRDDIPVQGGQFILQRGSSEGCLERWRRYIDSTPEESKDQVSLRKMWEEQWPGCHMAIMEQKPYIDFLSVRSMKTSSLRVIKRFYQKQNYATLIHIKNTSFDNLSERLHKSLQRAYFKLQKDILGMLLELSVEEVEEVIAFEYIAPNMTWTRQQFHFD